MIDFDVRRAEPADAPIMARVHVDTWRETYRGLMSDAALDDPALLSWREKFWAAAVEPPLRIRRVSRFGGREGNNQP